MTPGHLPQPLFRMDGVPQHLNLTPEQINRLNTLMDHLQQQFQPEIDRLNQLGEKHRATRLQELLSNFNTEAMKAAGSVLNDGQKNRLRQLELQQLGLHGLLTPDVQKQLNLTQEQQRILREAIQEEQQDRQQMMHRVQGQAMTQAAQRMHQARQKANQNMLGQMLTPQQMQLLRDLLGQPFTFPNSLAAMGQSGYGGGGYGGGGYGGAGYSSGGYSGQGTAGGGGDTTASGKGQEQLAYPVSTAPAKKPSPPAPDRGPFPEPLFHTNHVVKELDITGEQYDRLTTMAIQLQNRYRPELKRIERLDMKEQDARIEEMLNGYNAELLKGVASILTRRQMAAYRDFETKGGRTELKAAPKLSKP
jgi:hypothetical protein